MFFFKFLYTSHLKLIFQSKFIIFEHIFIVFRSFEYVDLSRSDTL